MDDNTRNPERKQNLLRILSDLVEIRRSRYYDPPLMAFECYREIHNWTLFSFVFCVFECRPACWHKRYSPLQSPSCAIHALLGHQLAVGYEMIPIHQPFPGYADTTIYLLEEDDGADDDDNANVDDPNNAIGGGGGVNDIIMEREVGISNTGVEVKDNGGGRRPVMKNRLKCLQIIVSDFIRIISLRSSPILLAKEVRLYTQIAKHVYSSIWPLR